MNFGTLRRNIISIDIYINKKLPRPTNIEQFRKKWTMKKTASYGRIKETTMGGFVQPQRIKGILLNMTVASILKLKGKDFLIIAIISFILYWIFFVYY